MKRTTCHKKRNLTSLCSFCIAMQQTSKQCLIALKAITFPPITGNSEQKKYFTDHRAAKAIQLFVAMREVFLLYYFSEQAPAKGNFPETTL